MIQNQVDPALGIDLVDFDLDHITHREHVFDVARASGHLGNMQQTIRIGQHLDKGTKGGQTHHAAVVGLADFGLLSQGEHPLARRVRRFLIRRDDEDSAAVVDVDLDPGGFDDLFDHLAAWSNHGPDFLGVDLHRDNPRCKRRKLSARLVESFAHLAQNMQPANPGLFKRFAQNAHVETIDFDVHLQGGDAVLGAGDLEVHVAEMIFDAKNVGQNFIFVAFFDQAHGHATDHIFKRHAGIHHGQSAGTGTRH